MTNIVLAAQAAGQGSGMSMIIMMVAIFGREDCPRRRRHRREDLCLQRHVECPLAEISANHYGESQAMADHQRLPV